MAYQQLSTEERHIIAAMRSQYIGMAEIARQLVRHRSTIYREVARNRSKYDGAYRAGPAVEHANGRRCRSRRNRRYGPADFAAMEEYLRERWSPEQIVGQFRRSNRPVMSHETIYRHIWADKTAGGALYRDLRGSSKQRRKRYRSRDSRGRLAGKTMIVERPEVVLQRVRFGDWEGDTVHGTTKACVLTLVGKRTAGCLIDSQ